MSDTESHALSANDRAAQPKTDYAVGYGKPPAQHRFKRGNRANPKGRTKGARNRKIVVRDILFEPVTIREGENVKQITMLEAVLKRLLSKAIGGDSKAALAILGIAQKDGLLTPEQEQVVDNLSESDQAIMEDVKRRLAEPDLEIIPETKVSTGGA
jgi:hypothetical protein